MTIIVRRPRLTQPAVLAELNRASPLTHGLRLLLTAAGWRMHDAANPARQWAVVNNTRILPTVAGQTISFDGVDDALSHTGYPEITGNVGTFFMWCTSVGASDTHGHTFFGTNTTTNSWFQVGTARTVHAWGIGSAQGLGSWWSTKNRSLVLTSAGTGASMRCYLDGASTSLTWTGTPASFAAGAKAWNAGRWVGGATWDTQADVLVMGYAARPWEPAEARLFHANPHLFFAPRRIIIPVGAAALPPHLTLSSGSLTQRPAPSASDSKLYLASSGTLVARQSPQAGDRRVTLESTGLVAYTT